MIGAGGGSRTRTLLRGTNFKSADVASLSVNNDTGPAFKGLAVVKIRLVRLRNLLLLNTLRSESRA